MTMFDFDFRFIESWAGLGRITKITIAVSLILIGGLFWFFELGPSASVPSLVVGIVMLLFSL